MWMSVQGYMEREPKYMGWGDSGHNKRQNFLTSAAATLPWNEVGSSSSIPEGIYTQRGSLLSGPSESQLT